MVLLCLLASLYPQTGDTYVIDPATANMHFVYNGSAWNLFRRRSDTDAKHFPTVTQGGGSGTIPVGSSLPRITLIALLQWHLMTQRNINHTDL